MFVTFRLIFFLAVTVTSIVLITERDEGVWDRTLVTGVTTTEILLSHLLTQGLIMILQTIEVLLVSFWLFGLHCEGSFVTVILLLLIQGLCGMCTGKFSILLSKLRFKPRTDTYNFDSGFSISVYCDGVISSNYVSMGSFVPIIVLSGKYNCCVLG